jgi:hypothetical protein
VRKRCLQFHRGCDAMNEYAKTSPKIQTYEAVIGLPGIVLPEYVRCGRPRCRCTAEKGGHLHGPYFYRHWWGGGRRKRTYVPRATLEKTQAACKRNEEFSDIIRANRRSNALAWTQAAKFLRELRALETRR